MAKVLEIAVTPWAPLGAGLLTGKFGGGARPAGSRLEKSPNITDRNLAIADELVKVAGEAGRTPAQVALSWLRRRSGVVVPIIGARTHEQLQDNMGCLDFSLPDDHMERLNEVSKIDLGFPHDFLTSEVPRDLIYGGTIDDIDNHRE
jgi:aryl-alcohol dehydrogenase-like predicted oxidoreductase